MVSSLYTYRENALTALAISGPAALLRGGHLSAGFRAKNPLLARGCRLGRGAAATPSGNRARQQAACFPKTSYLFVEFKNQGLCIHSDKSNAFDFISPVNGGR